LDVSEHFELSSLHGSSGAYQGNGFHEDGLKGGTVVVHNVLGKICSLSRSIKPMVPSLTEIGARLFVTRFLKSFITMGSLTLLKEGGTVISFGSIDEKTRVKSVVKVHNPQFYSKVAIQANLGFTETYIDGDISFVDKNGQENFFRGKY
ncbi:hypothetical protein GIB67_040853, partial [Kingdonia uniflora]